MGMKLNIRYDISELDEDVTPVRLLGSYETVEEAIEADKVLSAGGYFTTIEVNYWYYD